MTHNQRSYWVAFVSLFTIMMFAIMVNGAALAQEPETTETPETDTNAEDSALVVEDEGDGYQSCGECHLDYHAAWEDGVHAIAYDRESFQEAYQASGQDETCLNCHTTDFQPALNAYQPNILCEACHGHTPEDHPPETFVVNTDASTCGDCHTQTFNEWEHSLHAFTDDMGAVGCATCHNPHGQSIRFEAINDLCINCHQDNEENSLPYAESYIHVTHNEVEFEGVDLTCASCHMFTSPVDALHNLPDHTMQTETVSCVTCHETVSTMGISDIVGEVNLTLAEERDDLAVRVTELQAELEAEEGEEDNNVIQLTQGLIVGLGIGLTLMFVNRRRSA